MGRKTAVAVMAAGMLAIAGWSTAASADPYGFAPTPTDSTNTSIAHPCETVTVEVTGFQPNEAITVKLDGTVVGIGTTDATGALTGAVTVPGGVGPGPHSLVVTGASGESSTSSITVTGTCGINPPSALVATPPPAPHSESKWLVVNPSTVGPGETAEVTGKGCPPGTTVTLSIDGTVVGTTTADDQEMFTTSIRAPDVGAGQLTVTATCGSTQLASLLAVVIGATVSTPEASAAIFAVFVLLGFVLFRGMLAGGRSRRRRRKAANVLDQKQP